MSENNELVGDAAYIFLKTKLEEELYDLQSDPDEVHNLANFPAYSQKLQELRSALADWQMTIGDKGFIDEYDLVQMRWPGLKQPVTDEPVFKIGKNTIDISCSTEGASIAYQMNDEIGKQQWNVYHKPLVVKKGDEIVSRAVRIGYKTSTIESVKVE